MKSQNNSKNVKQKNTPPQQAYKPAKLLIFYICMGAIQLSILLFGFGTFGWLSTQEGDTLVGAGVIFGLLFALLFLIAAVTSIPVVIGLPIHLIRNKVRGKWLALSIATLLVSLLFFAQGVYSIYSLQSDAPQYDEPDYANF